MKKLVFFGLLAMFAINAVAQDDDNLVTNPSFESTGKGKLKKLKQITVAENWESPTGLNADLFDKTRAQPCSAPNNIYGKEFPMDGNRYAGIVAYSYNNKEPIIFGYYRLIVVIYVIEILKFTTLFFEIIS